MPAGKAYVISQIGDEGSEIRQRSDEICDFVVSPVAAEFDLSVMRSDRDATPGQITAKMLGEILAADVVIADLTGRNANVYYELGVVHSFGRPVVMLIDTVDALAFDTQDERVIGIGDSGTIGVSQADAAKGKLRDAIRIVLQEDYEPSSLVTRVASARSLDKLAPTDPIASELSEIRQQLVQVKTLVRARLPRSRDNGDIKAFVRLVEQLLADGRIEAEDLADAITDDTSEGFDTWINRLLEDSQES